MSVGSLVSEKYDDQIRSAAIWKASQLPQAIPLAVMNPIANEMVQFLRH